METFNPNKYSELRRCSRRID